MKLHNLCLHQLGVGLLLLTSTSAWADAAPNLAKDSQSSSDYQQKNFQRDNTGINQRDRSKETLTADQQSNQAKPLETTKRIRQAIVEKKDLSSYAHNVKIVTNDGGLVTLRGPVRNDHERVLLGQIAMDIAGPDLVRNELEITPEKRKS